MTGYWIPEVQKRGIPFVGVESASNASGVTPPTNDSKNSPLKSSRKTGFANHSVATRFDGDWLELAGNGP